nr:hypothetical transcript [Hymenolepis microstoma]
MAPIATIIQVARNDMKLHPSFGETVKITDLTHPLKSSTFRHCSTTCLQPNSDQNNNYKFCLLDHKTQSLCPHYEAGDYKSAVRPLNTSQSVLFEV